MPLNSASLSVAWTGPFGDSTHLYRPAPDEVLQQKYPFVLPPLGYETKALAPALDAATVQAHHQTVHGGHVQSLNTALAAFPALHEYSLGQLLMGLRRWPEPARAPIRAHGGAHANHALYWKLLAPGAATATAPDGRFGNMIARDFETVDACKAALREAALGVEGNGWAWLVKTATNRLAVRALFNDDSPLLDGELPVLGIDVWEHAYRRLYQEQRARYVDAVLARINWDVVGAQVE